MRYTLVVGGTRGIGSVIARRFEQVPDMQVVAVGRKLDYPHVPYKNVIFSQRRDREGGDPWQAEFDTGVTLTDRLMRELEYSAPASVVIISSLCSTTIADEQPAGYHAAKGALDNLVRYYAVKLSGRVRVNGIAPGVTLKPENWAYYETRPDKVKLFSELNPIGRMVTADDIAETAWAICQHMPAVTGEVIRVDGGVHCLNVESVARRFVPK